ncbi:MAG: threonylcarbamoyl-AMP synthase [Planctomycetaceae bacterium]|nr:threonylcarbamoyl-AMP synthase [Planctomycetales bacterium]MCB9926662.1 threonylcarbamoyl-AMP synthase [Planctomycetaceae bacterium]
MKKPAVFLDRDGTIIEDVGFIRDVAQVEFYPQTIAALRRLRDFVLFIVTNQSGIAKRLVTAAEAKTVNDYVVRHLAEAGVEIQEVYCCPHARDDRCECIKPNPYFPRLAERDHGIDLTRSFVVGDHPSDIQLAQAVGAEAVYVLTGHGQKHRAELQCENAIVAGIEQASERIVCLYAASMLRAGGVVALPTETVYGLGADASNEAAVRRVFSIKGRPANHPLIVHIGDTSNLTEWARTIPEAGLQLADRFWPGPLTLILPKGPRVSGVVTGGQDSVGLRVPNHPLALQLLREFRGGIAAPSANRFGLVSPTTAEHVRRDLGENVDFVLDGGACDVGVESTIIDLTSITPTILRPGGVTQESIEEVLGRRVPVVDVSEVRVSGQLKTHYAPRAAVVLTTAEALPQQAEKLREEGRRVRILSEDDIAPRELFASLRKADDEGVEVILVADPPNHGLGLAVTDRLLKAAAPRTPPE